MPYYTRTYNPQPTTRVASTDLKNEFQSIDNALDAVEVDVGKGIRAPEATTALPNAASRANKVLSFDGFGNPAVPIAVVDLTNAVTAASTATTQAGIATTQAGIATTQAGIATTQAGIATTQAGIATTQAGIATTQAGLATTQAGIATTQAGIATTQASDASTSASTATTQAGIATTQAGIASGHATTATTQAGIATTQAGIATTKAGEAATSASNVALTEKLNLGSKTSNPTVDNQGQPLLAGALYYNSVADETRVYTGSSWIAAGSAVNGTSARYSYTATASQTTFAATYDVGFVDVYLNGLKLAPADFTASNGTSVVLTFGAALNDVVDIVGYGAFEVANTYTQAQTDALLAGKQATLASGTNIKTVNGTSLLGSGDITIAAGRTPVWTAITSTGTYTVPSGVTSIRAYAVGKGGDGGNGGASDTSGCGGGGGGMAYGDIAVTAGQTFNITISAGVATLAIGGTTYLTANPGGNGAILGGTGGTASKHASVTNGGAYSGGVGGATNNAYYGMGGGSSGSPLGTGVAGMSAASGAQAGAGGSGWGGRGGGHLRGSPGGGAGGAALDGYNATGGAGGAAVSVFGAAIQAGPGRGLSNAFTDPLLAGLTSPGVYKFDTTDYSQIPGGPGAGGHGANVSGMPGRAADGGFGGGGGGCIGNTSRCYGGHGGFGGGGGGCCSESVSVFATGGNGGNGGGGGGAYSASGGYATGGTGGAAIVLIYA